MTVDARDTGIIFGAGAVAFVVGLIVFCVMVIGGASLTAAATSGWITLIIVMLAVIIFGALLDAAITPARRSR